MAVKTLKMKGRPRTSTTEKHVKQPDEVTVDPYGTVLPGGAVEGNVAAVAMATGRSAIRHAPHVFVRGTKQLIARSLNFPLPPLQQLPTREPHS
ncbi:hypothetical protein J6590_037910 [Homalodisca vitripennis]|nr:hypothetical protein J6590_037910 [Homalodisca vitripennis]